MNVKLTLSVLAVAALAAVPLCGALVLDEDEGAWESASSTPSQAAPAPPPAQPDVTFDEAEPVAEAPVVDQPKAAAPASKSVKPESAPRSEPPPAVSGPPAVEPPPFFDEVTVKPDTRPQAERVLAYMQEREALRQRVTRTRRKLGISDDDPAARGLEDLMGEPVDLFAEPDGAGAGSYSELFGD